MRNAQAWFLFTAIASLTLALGCWVLGNPNPCDRAQGMRDALEESTGRDCDIITEDDLADVYELRIYGADELEESDFSGLINLYSLFLHGGKGDLPWNVISGSSNLRNLILSGNNLSELPPDAFAGLENLQELSLTQNNLNELPKGLFDGLSNLSGLYLGGNPGDPFDIEVGLCGRAPIVRAALEHKVGRNCAIITDVDLSDVHSLTILDDNPTELQQGAFAGLVNLQHLAVYGDNLTELQPGAFNGLGNLQTLRLSVESLSELSPGAFNGLGNLQTLRLSVQSLSELSPGAFNGLGNLRTLKLGVGNLKELEPGVFAGLDNLEELSIWGTNLPEPKSGMFAMLVNLQTLSLESDNLTELPPEVFDDLENLQVLRLHRNPGRPFFITHPNANLRGVGWHR